MNANTLVIINRDNLLTSIDAKIAAWEEVLKEASDYTDNEPWGDETYAANIAHEVDAEEALKDLRDIRSLLFSQVVE